MKAESLTSLTTETRALAMNACATLVYPYVVQTLNTGTVGMHGIMSILKAESNQPFKLIGIHLDYCGII